MFTTFSSTQILVIVFGTAILYVIILAFVYGKKYWATPKAVPVVLASASTPSVMGAALTPPRAPLSTSMPSASDIVTESEDPEELTEEFEYPEGDISFLEEQHTTLLKEAERVVEEIQKVVDNIAIRPANPDEVFTKIQAIVSEYSFFFDTEYYDAINRFVAVTVHRDCDLELTEEDLKSLWYAAAA